MDSAKRSEMRNRQKVVQQSIVLAD